MSTRAPTIARIAAIPIQAHWSWLATSAAVLLLLHGVYARHTGALTALLLAAGAIVGLLASVVLHELGHALVARRYGLHVRAITLFALGGATETSSDASNPIADLLVTLAGPLVSLALALLGLVAWWAGQGTLAGLLALHLALTNAAVAAFNMLPGHPLDGSRALRAVLWFLLDNDLLAAQHAGQVGRNCGWLLIGGALAYLWNTGDLFNAGWVGLAGFALIRTSGSGYRQLVLRRTLGGVQVADVMQRAYRAVTPDLRLDQFVGQYLLGQTEHGFPVLRQSDQDAPQLLGMITVRHLRHYELDEWRFRRVGEVMTPADRVHFLAPDTPANEAFRVLLESGEEQLPVIDGQRLLGVVRRRDLVRHIQARLARLLGG